MRNKEKKKKKQQQLVRRRRVGKTNAPLTHCFVSRSVSTGWYLVDSLASQ